MSGRLSTASLLTAILFTLFGCGGGGGSGGVAINYEGEEGQVLLTEENAGVVGDRSQVAYAPTDLIDDGFIPMRAPVRALARVPGLPLTARQFRALPQETGGEAGDCGGALYWTATGSRVGLTFDNYCDTEDTDGDYFNGGISATGRETVESGEYAVTVSMVFNISISSPAISRTGPLEAPPLVEIGALRGTMRMVETGNATPLGGGEYDYDMTGTLVDMNLLIFDASLGYTLWFNDFEAATTYVDGWEDSLSLDGRIYFSDYGYVDISTPSPVDVMWGASGEIIVDGRDGSSMSLVQTPDWVWTAYLEAGDDVPPLYDDGVYPLTN